MYNGTKFTLVFVDNSDAREGEANAVRIASVESPRNQVPPQARPTPHFSLFPAFTRAPPQKRTGLGLEHVTSVQYRSYSASSLITSTGGPATSTDDDNDTLDPAELAHKGVLATLLQTAPATDLPAAGVRLFAMTIPAKRVDTFVLEARVRVRVVLLCCCPCAVHLPSVTNECEGARFFFL